MTKTPRQQLREATTAYEQARMLLGKENDIEALWKALTAADQMLMAIQRRERWE